MWEDIRETILSYERVRIEKVKGGRVSPWARRHSRPLCVSCRCHGGFPWKRTESPLQMYYYCIAANTWLFCIRDVTLHLIGASLGHSHTTHIVVPIHLNSLLPEPFFTFSWFYFSFYYKHSYTVTAYVILFDDIKVSVFETIVVYNLVSPVLVSAIFLERILSYWLTLWGA